MSIKTEMGRIKFFLVRKEWIVPTKKSTGLLYTIIKREGVGPIKKAINYLVRSKYWVEDPNDYTSKITILYLSSLCRNMPELREKKKEAQDLLDELIKDVLDD